MSGINKAARRLRHRAESPVATLPAPGPNPLAPTDPEITSVLIVLGGIELWLLSQGYGPTNAAEITGEICLLATVVTGRLTAIPFATLSKVMSVVKQMSA
jgi:hypothetical protein